MSRQRNRGRPAATPPSAFDQARDELFQHIMRCGVVGSEPEHMKEWFDETMQYMTERYHELGKTQIGDLRTLGERFAAPTKRTAPEASPAAEVPADASEAGDATAGELDTVSAA